MLHTHLRLPWADPSSSFSTIDYKLNKCGRYGQVLSFDTGLLGWVFWVRRCSVCGYWTSRHWVISETLLSFESGEAIVTRHEFGARRKYSGNYFLACSQTYAKPCKRMDVAPPPRWPFPHHSHHTKKFLFPPASPSLAFGLVSVTRLILLSQTRN